MYKNLKKLIGFITGVEPETKKEIQDAVEKELKTVVKQQTIEEQERKEADRSYCVFYLNKDNTVSLDFHFAEGSSSKNFGRMLYTINSGDVAPAMLKLLNHISETRPIMAPSIDNIIESWKNTIGLNQPVIRPSQVFKVQSPQE